MATGYDRSRIGFHAPPTIHVLPRVPCRAQDGEMKRILRGSEAAPAAAASFTSEFTVNGRTWRQSNPARFPIGRRLPSNWVIVSLVIITRVTERTISSRWKNGEREREREIRGGVKNMDDTPWEDGAYIDAQLSSITAADNGRASVKEWLFRERSVRMINLGWFCATSIREG